MRRLPPLPDMLAAAGIGLIFGGAFAVWPAGAIILLGAMLLALAIGLALLRRTGVAGTGHHEG